MGNKSFVFRFADVEVREREFTLIKAGRVLTVEPKAFRPLLFLLHNPQRLISKEELLNSLWGDAAVTEGSLTRCIWLLRRLLEDDIHEPRYIETVATVGYRFVCPVEVSEDCGYGSEAVQVDAEIADGAIQVKPRNLRRWWPVGAAVFPIGFVFAVWILLRPLPPPHITRYNQITHDGHQKIPAGTDGSRVYFMQNPPTTVGQVAIAGGEIVQIPVAVPFSFSLDDVSPDGSNFLIESGETVYATIPRPLWIVRIPGGPLRRLGDGFGSAFSPMEHPSSTGRGRATSTSFGAMGPQPENWPRQKAMPTTSPGRPTVASSGFSGMAGSGRYRRADQIFMNWSPVGTPRPRPGSAVAAGLLTGDSIFSCPQARTLRRDSRFGLSTSGAECFVIHPRSQFN
jgi:DNA-binding winged helix-turn-helix (wHTH) protein